MIVTDDDTDNGPDHDNIYTASFLYVFFGTGLFDISLPILVNLSDVHIEEYLRPNNPYTRQHVHLPNFKKSYYFCYVLDRCPSPSRTSTACILSLLIPYRYSQSASSRL